MKRMEVPVFCPVLRRMSAFAYCGCVSLLVGLGHHTNVYGFSSVSQHCENKHQWRSTLDDHDRNDFTLFDYTKQWYPVSFVHDLPIKKLVKVTVFDTDYAVARISDTEVIAMVDTCPHKMAALSEGRVTANGYIQCSYHGWAFNGIDGLCRQIPQASVITEDGKLTSKSALSKRSSGTAVPAMIVQRMVFLFLGSLEDALLAPPPPKLPDIQDDEPWKLTPVVRDFPIDWPILVENILDPDHGLFAHGAAGFDLYSANNDSPQHVNETSLHGGIGWTIASAVDAKLKLLALNMKAQGKLPKEKKGVTPKLATATFVAPSVIYQCRRDAKTGESEFVLPFYVTPTGTGRSRFMSAMYYKLPIQIPRWVFNVNVLNFLDQDTYLLATQQRKLLSLEQSAVNYYVSSGKSGVQQFNTQTRQKYYVYRSPTERMATRLSAFWDATLSRAPQRVETLLKLDLVSPLQPRSVILDREAQHLKICPDSQKVVRNCNRIMQLSRGVSVIAAVLKMAIGSTVLPKQRIFDELSKHLTLRNVAIIWSVSCITFILARKLKREFYFKWNDNFHEKDLSNIPRIWADSLLL